MKEAVQLIEIENADLETGNITNLKKFFNSLQSPDKAKAFQGRLLITFPKYDYDPREGFEIQEIRNFVQKLDAAVPHIFYFLSNDISTQTFFWLACLLPKTQKQILGDSIGIIIQPEALAQLLSPRFLALTNFCQDIKDDPTPVMLRVFDGFSDELRNETFEHLTSLRPLTKRVEFPYDLKWRLVAMLGEEGDVDGTFDFLEGAFPQDFDEPDKKAAVRVALEDLAREEGVF